MCLECIYKNKAKELPKEFTAYKVVVKKGNKFFFAIRAKETSINCTNVLSIIDFWEYAREGGKYRPYYHCLRTKAACKAVQKERPGRFCFIKIKIKREHITCVGAQKKDKNHYYQTIVSRIFTTEFEMIQV